MRVRCPHCERLLEVPADLKLQYVKCKACGNRFSLVDDDLTQTAHRKPRKIGHFLLTECIGAGAFGTVWKANDTKLDRVVAIKLPRFDDLGSRDRELFLRDARAGAQLRHGNIVGVHEVGRSGTSLYIAMDYIEGASLDEWLRCTAPSPLESAQLMATIANALNHAHERGVIHRDLKPGNIMMDRAGNPHLMDFGLAKRDSGEYTLTIDGATVGTPAYMSPEQASGDSHNADARSDVYSLGVVLYEMLTGARPFEADKRMLMVKILEDDPPSPRELDRQIPKDLETICLRCLKKTPSERFQSAKELAEDLRRYIQREPILSKRSSPIKVFWHSVRRNPSRAALACTLGFNLVLAIWYFIWRGQNAAFAGAGSSQLATSGMELDGQGNEPAVDVVEATENRSLSRELLQQYHPSVLNGNATSADERTERIDRVPKADVAEQASTEPDFSEKFETFRISTDEGNGADAMVMKGSKQKLGKNSSFGVRTRNGIEINHSYLRFDLSTLGSNRKYVRSARLVLTVDSGERPIGAHVRVYGLDDVGPWQEETLEWRNSYSLNGLDVLPLLADFDVRDPSDKLDEYSATTLHISSPEFAKAIAESEGDFFTIALSGSAASDNAMLRFVSREQSSEASPALILETASPFPIEEERE